MHSTNKWVALLDEDQDDFVIFQQGMNNWAPELELRWYTSFAHFEQMLQTNADLPASIVLNGISPSGSEIDWIRQFKLTPRLAEIPVIILAEEYWEQQKQQFKTVSIYDYRTKPVNQAELKQFVELIKDSSRHA
ncbi:response regulator [Spirosoma agri]|uniref:Response regulatory domain-containing protein n=1 Tax=Spirosoma agri TaxID=1987381 RepID=A0A6M0IKC3_9BACT|nr:hypothetical protein [Spirosoma agri]NEU67831.1 hypothetical protein [Spirosoma agri]